MLLIPGCESSSSPGDEPVPPKSAQTVVDQGMTLDVNASPAQVVYVLLQAIRDDVQAGEDDEKRQSAFRRQLAICATDAIFARSGRRSLGRDEVVRRMVWHWAPTLAYYVDSLPTTWEQGRTRLVESSTVFDSSKKTDQLANVYLELSDPSGDANAAVVAQFQLARDNGYWRVMHVGFARGVRHLPGGFGAANGNSSQKGTGDTG